MKDRKTEPRLRVVHRNDHEAVKRWLQGNGQSLLPMLELLENAQASIDELMNEAARAGRATADGGSRRHRRTPAPRQGGRRRAVARQSTRLHRDGRAQAAGAATASAHERCRLPRARTIAASTIDKRGCRNTGLKLTLPMPPPRRRFSSTGFIQRHAASRSSSRFGLASDKRYSLSRRHAGPPTRSCQWRRL
jgi:hypothetical protein